MILIDIKVRMQRILNNLNYIEDNYGVSVERTVLLAVKNALGTTVIPIDNSKDLLYTTSISVRSDIVFEIERLMGSKITDKELADCMTRIDIAGNLIRETLPIMKDEFFQPRWAEARWLNGYILAR